MTTQQKVKVTALFLFLLVQVIFIILNIYLLVQVNIFLLILNQVKNCLLVQVGSLTESVLL